MVEVGDLEKVTENPPTVSFHSKRMAFIASSKGWVMKFPRPAPASISARGSPVTIAPQRGM